MKFRLAHDDLLRSAQALEPMSTSTARLLALVNSEDVDIDALAEVASLDQRLTLGLLSAANSAGSRRGARVVSVRDAVLRAGFGQVLCLAMGAVSKPLMMRAVPEYNAREGELWAHSVRAALASEVVARHAKKRLPTETFTAALLYNVGKVVAAGFFSDEVVQQLAGLREHGLGPTEAEVELLGVSYADVGGLVAQYWGLPDEITRAIVHHTTPDLQSELTTDVVHVAAAIAEAQSDEMDWCGLVGGGAMQRLDLNSKAIGNLYRDVDAEFEVVSKRY